MIKLNIAFLGCIILVSGCQTLTPSVADKHEKPQSSSASSQVPFDDIMWDVRPNGRTLANIKGDFKDGPHTKIIKFSAGQKTDPHAHTYGYVGIVVKGVARHYEPNKPGTQKILPSGSYWRIPAGVVHISECLPEQDCVFVTQQEGLFDVLAVP